MRPLAFCYRERHQILCHKASRGRKWKVRMVGYLQRGQHYNLLIKQEFGGWRKVLARVCPSSKSGKYKGVGSEQSWGVPEAAEKPAVLKR